MCFFFVDNNSGTVLIGIGSKVGEALVKIFLRSKPMRTSSTGRSELYKLEAFVQAYTRLEKKPGKIESVLNKNEGRSRINHLTLSFFQNKKEEKEEVFGCNMWHDFLINIYLICYVGLLYAYVCLQRRLERFDV